MRVWKLGIVALAWIAGAGAAVAVELRADMHPATASGPGEAIGTVTIADSAQGAVVKTDLKGLPPGPHGFHVHENGSWQPATPNRQTVAAGAAGGAFRPPPAREDHRPPGGRPLRGPALT